MFVIAGPDAGRVEYQIDGGPAQSIELFRGASRGLHLPRSLTLNADLAPGNHTLTLRIEGTHHADSRGHSLRIAKFYVNE